MVEGRFQRPGVRSVPFVCLPAVAGCASLVLLLGGVAVVGCAGPREKTDRPPAAATQSASTGAAAAPAGLAGTSWRLVEFQSMDDAQGTTRASDPTQYTMRLDADGTVTMRLGCNRATGRWRAEPGAEGTSGRFEFGALATTSALCPPPRLDELVTRQAPYVRSFLLRDGRLFLSLMADGGIFAWAPHDEVAFATAPDGELEEVILAASPAYSTSNVGADDGSERGRYVYSRIDLNGDGRDEAFVYTLGSIFCGTGGCNLLLFTRGEDGYRLVDEFPITQTPVIASAERSNGWRDLVRHEAGGGAPSSFVRYAFDGTRYVEQGRSSGDTIPAGTVVLSGDITFEKGIPLEPKR